MTLPLSPVRAPARFADAADAVRAALVVPGRPELLLREVPAPRRLAPFALAVAAEVERDGEEVASGRFVVLHDPDGQEGWRGDTRVVTFVSADVDAEMAADPALAEVGWSWLREALRDRGATHTAAGGTVTRTVSARFGMITEPDEANEVEVRASWTPVDQPAGDGDGVGFDGGHAGGPGTGVVDLVPHLLAFCDLLAAVAGLPPPGVAALPVR